MQNKNAVWTTDLIPHHPSYLTKTILQKSKNTHQFSCPSGKFVFPGETSQ
jgi:hypothetical protein